MEWKSYRFFIFIWKERGLNMCDPVTLTIGVGALTAASTYTQVTAHNRTLEYNAQIQEQNAKIRELQALEAERRGRVEEQKFRQEVAGFKGAQRAAFAASGALLDTGTTYDVIAQTQDIGEMDALTIRHNAALEAWGYRVGALEATQQAQMTRRQKQSALLTAGTSLLTSAGRTFSAFRGG